ncbi:hypothetical protein DXG03_005800 [Asterophora parasitica]|uniref:Uncharacterized protein n=1 Tax=Asterophora parasitica TaxID=117018 RepID=A0A9P7KE48_9AGAR|nr:hypothetical protein DXG03_005800 [Asterophora parasitica]
MQYGRMPLPERRDSNLDSNGSNAGPQQQQAHPGPSSSHSPLFTVTPGHTSPALKRKQVDPSMQVLKRRRDVEEGDSYDIDGNGQGAKHWTDEEKSKLFSWLMGPSQDEHWNSLRATKNSCLRECANDVFGGKKTYQALKGCYERNFNLFKQIYSFETFHARAANLSALNEGDRLREYERRIQSARKAGCDVGNVAARTIDHWHRVGWYDLFYRRWHGDPATTRPTQTRNSNAAGSNPNGGDDADVDDDPQIFADPMMLSSRVTVSLSHDRPPQSHSITALPNTAHPNTTHTHNVNNYVTPQPQPLRDPVFTHTSHSSPGAGPSNQQQPNAPVNGVSPTASSSAAAPPNGSDPTVISLAVTHNMLQAYMQYLQVQTQTSKTKLEYMRRREEREEKESAQRREAERLRMEREKADLDFEKQKLQTQSRTQQALVSGSRLAIHHHVVLVYASAPFLQAILENPTLDDGIKQSAGNYLKSLFTVD